MQVKQKNRRQIEKSCCAVLWELFAIWQTLHKDNRVIGFHVPNGGFRNPREASIMKRMGVRAGVADYVFCTSKKVLMLEIKTGKVKPSSSQLAFKTECDNKGIEYRLMAGDSPKLQSELFSLFDQLNEDTKNGQYYDITL